MMSAIKPNEKIEIASPEINNKSETQEINTEKENDLAKNLKNKQSTENKKDSPKDQLNYVKILQIFPDLHPIALRKMFNRCNKDFCRTVDNILFVKRYCSFLHSVRKYKLTVSETKKQNNENLNNFTSVNSNKGNTENSTFGTSQVQNYIDRNNHAPVHYTDTSAVQVQNYADQNNYSSGQYYHLTSGMHAQNYENQHMFSPTNTQTHTTGNNMIAHPVPVNLNYYNNTSYMIPNYNYPYSPQNDSSTISAGSNNFYNSQDINTTNSSSYSNPIDTYIPNGSIEGITCQLNNFISETAYDNHSFQYNWFSNNYQANFRTSTPELRDFAEWQF